MMIEEIDRYAAEGRSFAFETTLSGRTYLQRIDGWRAAGYGVELIFLSLHSAEAAVARVATRVKQGGHNIPPDVVMRRFAAGRRNFAEIYRDRVDGWQWFDTGIATPTLLEHRSAGVPLVSPAILRAARRARDIASHTNTPLITERDGVVCEEWITSSAPPASAPTAS